MRGSLNDLAKAALSRYDFSPCSEVSLINVSENSTYRVDDPSTGKRAALRIHRPGYHSKEAIASELAWMEAVHGAGFVRVPRPLHSLSGDLIVDQGVDDIPPRSVVLFEWLDGVMPTTEGDLVPGFRILGGIAAQMHAQSRAWRRPASFTRHAWDYESGLGEHANWGRWQDGLGIGTEERTLLGRLDQELRDRLGRYGRDDERFGLAHTDLRLTNLLEDGSAISVLDFDDCGFAWFMYDYASALTFFEEDPRVPELEDAWIEGYRGVAPLAEEDVAILPTMVMFRRLVILAWIGSHHEFADEASEFGIPYTEVTCALAEKYLSDHT